MAANLHSSKPQSGEYAPFAEKYIALVPVSDIVARLEQQRRDLVLLLSGRSEEDGDFSYAAGKWTVKQALGHINDTERIFAYRALRIARGDKTHLPGFEQDNYVHNGGFELRSLADLIEDFIAVRRSSVSLFRNLPAAAWTRTGTASNHDFSVRALAYMTAGHELHHTKILGTKYFSALAVTSK